MKTPRFAFCILLTAFVWTVGCATRTTKPTPNPLEGWHFYSRDKVSKGITDDYQDYIQKLPSEERYYVAGGDISFFEDGSGQHAVKIQIPLNGAWHEHVLIYSSDNKRIKVIKYVSGRYAS